MAWVALLLLLLLLPALDGMLQLLLRAAGPLRPVHLAETTRAQRLRCGFERRRGVQWGALRGRQAVAAS
jgi:hypothetical protein